MKYPLRKTGLVERVLSVMLDDAGYARRYYWLTQDGAERARRHLVGAVHARARRCSVLIARRPGLPEVPL